MTYEKESKTIGWGRFWLGVCLQAGLLVIGSLVVGLPMGFFQFEITEAIGPVGQVMLSEALNSLSTFAVCAYFAYRWSRSVYLSTVMSFIAANLVFWVISSAIGGYAQLIGLMLLSLLLSFVAAISGAWAGTLARRTVR